MFHCRFASSRRVLAASQILASLAAFAHTPGALSGDTPVGTAFTYQGLLQSGGAPISGVVDVKVRLYDAASVGNVIGTEIDLPGVTVADGLLQVDLDFGALAFNGEARWIEIDVRSPARGAGAYTTLAPRQAVLAAPYALLATSAGTAINATQLNGEAATFYQNAANLNAGTIPSARLAGSYDSAISLSNPANAFAGSGAGLTNLPWASLAGIPAGFADGIDNDSSALWTLNGANIYRGSGNVGIGTTSPTAKLHVAGDVRATNTVTITGVNNPFGQALLHLDSVDQYSAIDFLDNGVSRWGMGKDISDNFYIDTPSGNALIILNVNRNVGIGTTTPNANWRMVIENGGAAQWKGSLAAGSSTGAKAVLGELSGIATIGAHNAALNAWQTLHINPTGGIIMAKDAGNVGIRTTNPGYPLHVVQSSSNAPAIYAEQPYPNGTSPAIIGSNQETPGTGIGVAGHGGLYGVQGVAATSSSTANNGVWGHAEQSSFANIGVLGDAVGAGAVGVFGSAPISQGYAGHFQGHVIVTNTLVKGGGAFRIDHPLDPESKELWHSFVESPDMKNIYDGNVKTDGAGYANVTLPDYFESLNREFRYQITVLDEADSDHFVMAKVVRKIAGNQFTIRTSVPFAEVSWQVTGVRQDRFAEANRIPNEVEKRPEDRGLYLHPEAFGQPANKGVDWKHSPKGMEQYKTALLAEQARP